MTRAARHGYEPDTASPKIGGAALLGVLALIPFSAGMVAVVFWGFQAITHPREGTALDRTPIVRSGPRLEVTPKVDRIALERRAASRLEGYEWTPAGRARIPIERAMALQAQRGWPDGDSSTAPQP